MIWTEEENDLRTFDNMMNPDGKSCQNCQWGNGGMLEGSEEDKEWVTCGHHHENFKKEMMCAYWTDPKDPRLKAYFEKRRKEMKAKIEARKK
jgi:hypothetical protein